jgi:hypothetical protein
MGSYRRKTDDDPEWKGNRMTQTLDHYIPQYVSLGWTVAYRSDERIIFQGGSEAAQAASGTNHTVHAILTLFTAGLWLLVWIPAALFSRPGGGAQQLTVWRDPTPGSDTVFWQRQAGSKLLERGRMP